MRLVLFIGLVALAAPALRADDDPEPPPPATKAIQGTWTITSLRMKGMNVPLPAEAVKKWKIVITRDGVKMDNGKGEEKTLTLKLDPKKAPAHIDLIDKGNRKTVLGIYKVEKGELHLGMRNNTEGKARPKDFTDDDVITMVLKKEKK